MFLSIVHFWWWEYNLHFITKWTFTEYIFLILYITLYFLQCQLLYPSDVKDYNDNYQIYFFSRKKWFFLIMGLIYVVDLFDTLLKGSDYVDKLMPLYGIRMVLHLFFCLYLAFSKSRSSALYGGVVLFFILFELYFIVSRYYINI